LPEYDESILKITIGKERGAFQGSGAHRGKKERVLKGRDHFRGRRPQAIKRKKVWGKVFKNHYARKGTGATGGGWGRRTSFWEKVQGKERFRVSGFLEQGGGKKGEKRPLLHKKKNWQKG